MNLKININPIIIIGYFNNRGGTIFVGDKNRIQKKEKGEGEIQEKKEIKITKILKNKKGKIELWTSKINIISAIMSFFKHFS